MSVFKVPIRPSMALRTILCSHELFGFVKGHMRLQLEQLNPLKS
jgi:hypothetical protein